MKFKLAYTRLLLMGLIGFASYFMNMNCSAKGVEFKFEQYSGGANYFWLFNGDYGSVNTTRNHELHRILVECATPDCSVLKLSHKSYESETYKTFITVKTLLAAINGNERLIKYPSQTKSNLKKSWDVAIDLDGPGTGIFLILGAVFSVFSGPAGVAVDIYNACHGDGSCKQKIGNAIQQIKSSPEESSVVSIGSRELSDLINFIRALGERFGAPSLDRVNEPKMPVGAAECARIVKLNIVSGLGN